MKHKILLIPDAYLGNYSGAYVAQIARDLLLELGHNVAVFTDELTEHMVDKHGIQIYSRLSCSSSANWKEKAYISNFESVLKTYNPDTIFTLGSVTNKPVCYWRIARERGLRIISKIFMQDFFCSNYYANDKKGLCTKCLDKNFFQCVVNGCSRVNVSPIKKHLSNINAAITRYKLQKQLVLADAVIASSKQQVEFYVKYGIPRENCYITPLYFNGDKLTKYTPTCGDYYVFVAQNRIDKGIHLLKDVLKHCSTNVRVIAAYATQQKIDEALTIYGLAPYVESGILEMRPNCTWNTSLGEIISASRGVVNPSIWPSTTEFVLLETLGLKKPIFTFNVGIHPEIIKSGYNGFVANSPKMMAAQMNELADNDTIYYDISKSAYDLYKKMTDRQGWKNKLNEILEK